jgi:hypothetical protein
MVTGPAREIHPSEGLNPARGGHNPPIPDPGQEKPSDRSGKLVTANLTRARDHENRSEVVTMLDCKADVYANGRQYTVRASTLPPAGEHGELIEVTLGSTDSDGTDAADGAIRLPLDGLAAVGRLLNQIMTGVSTLNGRPAGRSATNAQAPWTTGQDEELMELWLAAGDTYSASTVRRELAAHFGRSMGAIRARLLRIGANPEAPGHAFVPREEDGT